MIGDTINITIKDNPNPKVECREPREDELFRVHPSPNYREVQTLAFDKETGHWYLIAEKIAAACKRERPDIVKDYMVFTAQNTDGDMFLWPIEMPVSKDHPVWGGMKPNQMMMLKRCAPTTDTKQ